MSRSAVSRTFERGRDALLRSTGYQFKDGSTVEAEVTYYWNAGDGRLDEVEGAHAGGHSDFAFTYQDKSFNLPFIMQGPSNQTFWWWMDDRDVLDVRDNMSRGTYSSVSTYDYSVNVIGQRTNVALTGSEFAVGGNDIVWGYDSKGQVVKADRSENGSSVSSGDRGYTYDGIGNRYRSSRNSTNPASASGSNLATYYSDSAGTTEGANALNQYLKVGLYGASPTAQVYDADGNQTDGPFPNGSDGDRWWDGEDRMYRSQIGSTDTFFAQDPFGRRVAKFQGGGSGMTGTVYFYDGWNVAAELTIDTSSYSLDRTYTWGPDLSGTFQGAGGVGGLLAVEIETGWDAGVYYPTFDGNGNVSEYMDSSCNVVAHYEYDPFGEAVVTAGSKASLFNYRFSTKPRDSETGLYYYGFRFYDPTTGRWPGRDPIGEEGGVNVYGFVGNASVGWVDHLGGRPLNVTLYPAPPGDTPGAGINDAAETIIQANMERLRKDEPNEIVKPVESIRDANLVLTSLMKDDCCIRKLEIEGHANPGAQIVGRNISNVNAYEKWLGVEKVASKDSGVDYIPIGFGLFSGVKFCSECMIVLRGCSVGGRSGQQRGDKEFDEAKVFAKWLANATGCSVYGFKEAGYPDPKESIRTRPKGNGLPLLLGQPDEGNDPAKSLKLTLDKYDKHLNASRP